MNEVHKSVSSHKERKKKKKPTLLGRSFQWLELNHREINLVQTEISIALFWLYLGAEKLLKIDQDSLPNILFILILCSCKICKNCNNFLLKILLKCWDYFNWTFETSVTFTVLPGPFTQKYILCKKIFRLMNDWWACNKICFQ